MIFVKYVFLFLIFITSSYIGILKSKSFENRVSELQKFKSALNMLKTKIEFTHEPIKNIFKDISEVIYENSQNIFLLTNVSENLYLSWCSSLESSNYLKTEDKEIIKAFGKQLRKVRHKWSNKRNRTNRRTYK